MKLLALFILLFGLGCQDRISERDREEKIEEAGRLIDEDRYDSAIQMLEELVTESPNDDVRMYLASAYAGRAGLKSPDYWAIAKRYKQIVTEEKKQTDKEAIILEADSLPAAVPGWIRALTPKFDENLRTFNQTRRRLSALPLLTTGGRHDLDRARTVLLEVDTEGGHLYRAVLGIVLLRTYFENANRLSVLVQKDKAGICSPAVGQVIYAMVVTYDLTQDILKDLRGAFPSQTEEAARLLAETKVDEKTEAQMRALGHPGGRNICMDFPLIGAKK